MSDSPTYLRRQRGRPRRTPPPSDGAIRYVAPSQRVRIDKHLSADDLARLGLTHADTAHRRYFFAVTGQTLLVTFYTVGGVLYLSGPDDLGLSFRVGSVADSWAGIPFLLGSLLRLIRADYAHLQRKADCDLLIHLSRTLGAEAATAAELRIAMRQRVINSSHRTTDAELDRRARVAAGWLAGVRALVNTENAHA